MMQVDFHTKKTEQQWQQAIDAFLLSATPKWFDWLQWIAVLGVLQFILNKTKDIWVLVIYTVSFTLFMMYLYSYFFQIEWLVFKRIGSTRVKRIISLSISATIAYVVYMLLRHLALVMGKTGA